MKQIEVDALEEKLDKIPARSIENADGRAYSLIRLSTVFEIIKQMPPAQPEQPTEVQDILQYLDEYLHPIVSPEYWSVYSELYDMVSMLQSSQPERKTGRWILYDKRFPWRQDYKCSECGNYINLSGINCGRGDANYCPNCGAKMEGDLT